MDGNLDQAGELTFRLALDDAHLIGLEVSFAARAWAGRTIAYTQDEPLCEFKRRLTSFARDLSGEAVFDAGADAGELGFVCLRFWREDERGHIGCSLELKADGHEGTRTTIRLETEPVLLDEFIGGLARLLERQGDAVLRLR